MDLQNVKNLTIPEGSVKTIHDKDSKLLWGAVGYDTKYTGDTTQQTYSGKNLVGFGTITATGCTYTVNNNVYTITAITNSPSIRFELVNTIPAGTYTWSGAASLSNWTVSPRKTDGTSLGVNGWAVPRTATTTDTMGFITFFSNIQSGDTTTLDLSNFQLESGSTATSWEPFVGGQASPSPLYPQNINVVTGNQTITISDSTLSEDFDISLGNIELCKIGAYQDYIYKSGGDWYVHKAINKYEITSENSGSWYLNTTSYAVPCVYSDKRDLGWEASWSTGIALSNRYSEITSVSNISSGKFSTNFVKMYIWIFDDSFVDLATARANLVGTIIYIPLATPTDTKITDNTLIGQLNAIHQWLTRYGYSATVSGNLPIVIDRTNL